MIPNGNVFSCRTCHNSVFGGDARNPFGLAVQAITGSSGVAFWSPTLAAMDSDGDGFTNGEELGDPDGDGTPMDGHEVTNPGDAQSKPADVNQPPSVTLTGPAGGATFPAPARVSLTADASDSDGSIAKVEFLENDQVLGEVTTAPYAAEFDFAVGAHTVTARATDDDGAVGTSTAVSFTVTESTNAPPQITLTEPAAGATFSAPALAAVSADVTDPDGTIARVEFFTNGRSLGVVTTPPYSLMVDWPVGAHAITARATDDLGLTTTSAETSMTVQAPEAPSMGTINRTENGMGLSWTGGGGPFSVQTRGAMADPWCSVSEVVTNRAMDVSTTGSAGFFRVVDLAAQAAIPLSAILNGAFERPDPIDTAGTGSGTFQLSGNTLTFDIQYAGLSGPATRAHIHGPGTMDVSAPVMIDLEPFNGGTFGSTGAISGSVVLTSEQKAAVLSGRTYVNFHTEAHTAGEIRGQILPVLMQTVMNGSNERPNPVATAGTGQGLFLLVGDQLTFEINYRNLTGAATMAHIHGPATADAAAPVLISLEPFNGGAFGPSGGFSGTVTLTTTQLVAVASGLTYVNVHTEANGGGEIRGQILPNITAVPLSTSLSGVFERPDPIEGPGSGAGIAAVDGDRLVFNLHYRDLSGVATAAHIHGPADSSTSIGVMINFAPFNNGSFGTNGTIAGSVALTAEQKAALLAGQTYANVHTAAHTPGEIRGQWAPVLTRASLSGANERPDPIDTPATGSAHFLRVIDRLWMNITYRGLSGPATNAHIHGPADEDSSIGVLQGLNELHIGPFAESGMFAGSIELDVATANALVDGLTYVNVHTAAHTAGEIRGQILRPGSP